MEVISLNPRAGSVNSNNIVEKCCKTSPELLSSNLVKGYVEGESPTFTLDFDEIVSTAIKSNLKIDKIWKIMESRRHYYINIIHILIPLPTQLLLELIINLLHHFLLHSLQIMTIVL